MSALALAVLGASLVGSVHCAAMCGGLVAVYAADPSPRAGWRRGLEHAAYNGGRLLAYASLGAVAGALGAGADLAGDFVGLGRLAAIAAGALITLWGLAALLDAIGVSMFLLDPPRRLRVAAGRAFALIAGHDPVARAAVLGVATGLMPCGWLYAFVLAAAGTGSPLAGAGLMLVFWAGTVPMMAGVGIALRIVALPLRRYLPAAAAVAMIVVGLLTVSGRLGPPAGDPVTTRTESGHGHR
ncbi:MAG: sulfite exporter TauE/SafE family protein [Candidatus Rokuibacteriota bacterium]